LARAIIELFHTTQSKIKSCLINFFPKTRTFTQILQTYINLTKIYIEQTKNSKNHIHQSKSKSNMMNLNLFLLSAAAMVSGASGTQTGVPLGTAADFVVLSKAGITNVVDSTIIGDMGVSPIAAGSMTGFGLELNVDGAFATSTQVTGSIYAPEYTPPTDVKLTTAISDMLIAYNDGIARTATPGPFNGSDIDKYSSLKGGAIGGLTLTPGVYTFTTDVTIATATELTLDGGGDSNSVFIITTSKNVKQAADTKVILTNGAKPENVFWVVAQTFEVGARAEMKGILLVNTAVTFITSSKLIGRILSFTSVALQMVDIKEPPKAATRGLRGLQVA
jgi:hypothetical protein